MSLDFDARAAVPAGTIADSSKVLALVDNNWAMVLASALRGLDGSTIIVGTGVPSNGTGSDNDLYFRSSNSDLYQKQSGVWAVVSNLQGAAGANGATWITPGTSVPSSGTGSDGDYYLRTSTYDVYRKSGGAWSILVNIRGATGATGPAGSTGPQGPDGPNLVNTSTSTTLSGMLYGNGTNVNADGNIGTNGIGGITVTSLAAGGTTSLDSGAIYTDSTGNLVAASVDATHYGDGSNLSGITASALYSGANTDLNGVVYASGGTFQSFPGIDSDGVNITINTAGGDIYGHNVTGGYGLITNSGDVIIEDYTRGVVLRDSNNVQWRITVDTSGTLVVAAV